MAGVLAEPPLDRGHGAESGQDLARRDAGDQLAGQIGRVHATAVEERVKRRRMDFGVLADLERGEMEAERLDLPAEVLDLAVGDARQSVGDQPGLDLGQLFDQLLSGLVVPGHRSRFFGEVPASAPQPFGDRAHAASIRLVGEAARQIAHRLGQFLGVARQPILELGVDPLA